MLLLDLFTGRRVFRAGRARFTLDLRSGLGVPYISAEGDPKDFGKAIRKVKRYCDKKGIRRVSAALDLREVKPEVARLVVRRGAVPILLIVEMGVNRLSDSSEGG